MLERIISEETEEYHTQLLGFVERIIDEQDTECFLHNRNPQSCNQEFPTIAK